ncbi:MAG: ABC transporter ATP-binding protein [Anaerolineaceae bacterium]|nr:ABC transporter ATP-binding protein [Anaerolineaceae bacterium]
MSQTYDEEDLNETISNTKGVFKRLFEVVKPHWKTMLGAIIGISLVSIADSVYTLIQRTAIDQGILAGNRAVLWQMYLYYALLIVFQSVFVFIFIYMVGLQGERIRYDLRKMMFNHLQKLSLSYYSKTPLGWIMSRVTSDTEKTGDLLTWGMTDITWASVNIITASVFMLMINWKLALIVIASLPLMIYVAIKFRKRIYYHYRLSRKANSHMTANMNENITGVRIVKALRREEKNLDNFKILSTDMFRSSYRAAYLSALFMPTIQTISALSLGLILWSGGNMVNNAIISIGSLQAFISFIMMILWPIQDIARVYAEMQNALASSERIFNLLDTQPAVHNRAKAIPTASLRGEVEFDHVSFHYDDDETEVIKDLSFKIPQGQNIALVGSTGGGKTTIVNLICRFYEPSAGVIRIAGKNYFDYKLEDIQSRIGVVLQTPHLFSGTVMENIRYGKLESTDEQVQEAARLAGAHDFITSFEKGYDQNVGEGGNLLSVGQKQLISIARALLADPDIFIMDEATSSVDTLTEALIQNGMQQLMSGRTSFIIAHRLSTIKHADQILVIDEGRIVESGSHDSLMKRKGRYYNLYTQQFRHNLETEMDPFAGTELNSAGVQI